VAVMIGVDPHRGSHTAVAIDGSEEGLGKLKVRASANQLGALFPGPQPGPSAPSMPGSPLVL